MSEKPQQVKKSEVAPKKPNHNADIENPNKGTKGMNDSYKKAIDNRANQLNPNNKEYKGKEKK